MMLRFCILTLLILQAVTAIREDETFKGWHDFALTLKSDAEADIVREFAENNDCMIARVDNRDRPQNVLVRAEEVNDFKELLTDRAIEFEIPNTDIGQTLLEEKLDNAAAASKRNRDPTTYFARTAEIYKWMRQLENRYSEVKVSKYGTSYEKRDLLVMKLSTGGSSKPIIFLDATIHAREWLATATVCYLMKALIDDRSSDLVKKYDWYFVPVVNPDGYEYSHRGSSTRYWRKTRKPYGRYYGADGNRNFGYKFGGVGTSNNPASDLYHGPYAFSEPETKALGDYLSRYKSQVNKGMYFSFHTYGQMWLTPPGYTRVKPSDHNEMMRVANAGVAALRKVNNRSFKVGQPANIGLYEATGGSYDWVKFSLRVKYSYTFELYPRSGAGLGGFNAKTRDILPSGKEIYAALKASVKARFA